MDSYSGPLTCDALCGVAFRSVHKTRLKDVAALAGVAVNTASSILNRRPNSWASKATEERVFRAAAELGYKPNRAAVGLRVGRFNAIALVIADLHNPYYTAFADAFEDAAAERGYDVLIECWRNEIRREKHILEDLDTRQVDGIAAFISDPEAQREYLSVVATQKRAFIALSTTGGGPLPVDSTLADFETGLSSAVDALLKAGHRRVAFVSALAEGQYAGRRPELFRRLMIARGISEKDFTLVASAPTIEGARESAAKILKGAKRPTAVIALNDLSAIGVMRAAVDTGLHIPRDLSVIGADDIPLGVFLPVSLSTIAQPISEMARFSATQIISRIESKSHTFEPVTRVFPTTFIPRESIGAAR